MSSSSSTFLPFTQQQHVVARPKFSSRKFLLYIVKCTQKARQQLIFDRMQWRKVIYHRRHKHVFNTLACKHDKLRFNQLWKCSYISRLSHLSRKLTIFPLKLFSLSSQQIKLQIESNNIVDFRTNRRYWEGTRWKKGKVFSIFFT